MRLPAFRRAALAKTPLVVILLVFLPSVSAIQYNVETFSQSWASLSDATTLWYGKDGTYNDEQKDVDIGFTFRYFGKDYTKVRVSTNGYITMLDASISPGSADGTDNTNDAIPSTEDPDNYLAPWWDDLVVRNQGFSDKVSNKTSGTSPNRVFTVEYLSISSNSDNKGSYISFQVKLYETTNVVEFHYWSNNYNLDFTPSATVGIENADGSYGIGGPSSDGTTSSFPTRNYRFTPVITHLASDESRYVDLTSEQEFSFLVVSDDWATVGIRNIDGYDHDIIVDNDSAFSWPYTSSTSTGSEPDFVVVNGHRNYGTHYARDYASVGSGRYNRIEAETSTTPDLGVGVAQGASMDSDEVNEMYEAYLWWNTDYVIVLDVASGNADLDLYLFDKDKTVEKRIAYTKVSDNDDGGASEVIPYTPSDIGDAGILVIHDGTASDYANYTIKVSYDTWPTISADASPGAESYNDGSFDWYNASALTATTIDVDAAIADDAKELRAVYWRLEDSSGNPVANTQDNHKNTSSYYSYDILTTSDNAGWLSGSEKTSKRYDDFMLSTHFTSSQLNNLYENSVYRLKWRVEENDLKDQIGGKNYQSSGTYSFKIDRTPPTTSISLSGAQGQLGWYNSSVQVTLSASDSASGVASTKYCTSSSSCAPDMTYSSAFTISSEGTTYVRYRSTDRVGNTELTRNATLKIDKTGPSSLITSPSAGSAQATDFSVSATDSDLTSGLDKCEYKVVSNGTETRPWTARTCSSSFTVTVGSGNDCRHDGTNTCTVYIRANDKAGNLGSAVSRSFSISTNQPPTASFTVTPTSGDTTTIFNVDASSSTDDKDPVTSLQVRWDWENDGTYDTSFTTTKTASHQYTTVGTYTIRLEVKDTGGLTATATRQVGVTLPNNQPIAVIIAPSWVTQSDEFTLDGSASYDPDGDAITYTWSDNQGDFIGITGVKPSVSLNTVDHGYKKNHTITLVVSDGRGGSHTTTTEITVIPLWAPTWWSELGISYGDGEVNVSQAFSWNEEHLNYLKNLDVFYQWELRRDADYWDYRRPGWDCYKSFYWTNLNDPTDIWTEENSPSTPCFWSKGNEEFEIKSGDVNSLQPEKTYFAIASFLRKDPDKQMNLTAKSEYCGKNPFCNFGSKFDWFAKIIEEIKS